MVIAGQILFLDERDEPYLRIQHCSERFGLGFAIRTEAVFFQTARRGSQQAPDSESGKQVNLESDRARDGRTVRSDRAALFLVLSERASSFFL